MARRLDQLDDSRLAARVHAGRRGGVRGPLRPPPPRAAVVLPTHARQSEDGEDALQQTFLRAHRALEAGQLPDTVRPWLFAIARNRCKTMLAARREACVSVDDVEPSIDGLADDVAARADLRELVTDLGRLPEDQRAALVLFELGGMSQAEIAGSIGVPAGKVKALVFQARTELMAERDARSTPCNTIREELAVARGGSLRRGPLRRHLKHCEPVRPTASRSRASAQASPRSCRSPPPSGSRPPCWPRPWARARSTRSRAVRRERGAAAISGTAASGGAAAGGGARRRRARLAAGLRQPAGLQSAARRPPAAQRPPAALAAGGGAAAAGGAAASGGAAMAGGAAAGGGVLSGGAAAGGIVAGGGAIGGAAAASGAAGAVGAVSGASFAGGSVVSAVAAKVAIVAALVGGGAGAGVAVDQMAVPAPA